MQDYYKHNHNVMSVCVHTMNIIVENAYVITFFENILDTVD